MKTLQTPRDTYAPLSDTSSVVFSGLPIVDENDYMSLEEMHARLVTTIENFYKK